MPIDWRVPKKIQNDDGCHLRTFSSFLNAVLCLLFFCDEENQASQKHPKLYPLVN